VVKFLNNLNLSATRPVSLIRLSLEYHFQPSVPTGGWRPMTLAVLFYLTFAAIFFFIGSYMFKEVLQVWFKEAYQNGWRWGLVAGSLVFWNTMYLLRFGLFVLCAMVAAALATYPIRTVGALLGVGYLIAAFLYGDVGRFVTAHPLETSLPLVVVLASMIFEGELLRWFKESSLFRAQTERARRKQAECLQQFKDDPDRALAVVYTSGDDLGFQKLTAELLVDRLRILRDQLGSQALFLCWQPWTDPPATKCGHNGSGVCMNWRNVARSRYGIRSNSWWRERPPLPRRAHVATWRWPHRPNATNCSTLGIFEGGSWMMSTAGHAQIRALIWSTSLWRCGRRVERSDEFFIWIQN
jgi:hypothetical protein